MGGFRCPNARNGVVPEDANGLGPLLRLQQRVLQRDGRVQNQRERGTLAVYRGADDCRVDHRAVRDPGNEIASFYPK